MEMPKEVKGKKAVYKNYLFMREKAPRNQGKTGSEKYGQNALGRGRGKKEVDRH